MNYLFAIAGFITPIVLYYAQAADCPLANGLWVSCVAGALLSLLVWRIFMLSGFHLHDYERFRDESLEKRTNYRYLAYKCKVCGHMVIRNNRNFFDGVNSIELDDPNFGIAKPSETESLVNKH